MAASTLHRLLRFLPVAALGVVLASGAPAEAAASESKVPTIDAPFLWQINGGEKPSYLFGTIHAGVAAEELPSVVNASLRTSDFFVMETSPGDVYPPLASASFPMGTPMDLSLAEAAHKQGARVGTLESMRFEHSKLGGTVGCVEGNGDSPDQARGIHHCTGPLLSEVRQHCTHDTLHPVEHTSLIHSCRSRTIRPSERCALLC